jgi:hypothetical protein
MFQTFVVCTELLVKGSVSLVFSCKEVSPLFLVLVAANGFFVIFWPVGFVRIILALIPREVIMFLPSLKELLASNLNFPVSLTAVIIALTLV